MLEKMSSAICVVRLETGAGVDPDTNSCSAGSKIRLSSHTKAIGEGGDAGLRSREYPGVVHDGGVRGAILEEPSIRIFKLLQLRFHRLCDAVVDHGIGGRR